ncbi:MAG: hypothetical protein ACOYOV_12470 [Bacteroidales bacterium]
MAKGTKEAGWQDKYDVVGIEPGIIVHGVMGKIDLSRSDIPLETIEKLSQEGCPYIILKNSEK